MKHFVFAFVFLIFLSETSQGQYYYSREGSTKLSLGPALGVAASNPLKDLPGNKGWGLGIGGLVQLEHFFHESLNGVAQTGIISFAGRAASPTLKNKAFRTIPIRIGANGYMGNFHMGAQVGVGINSRSSKSVTQFAYSPQIGYNFSRDNVPLDFTVAYDAYAGQGGFSAFLMKLSIVF